jgi:hypothetical protein
MTWNTNAAAKNSNGARTSRVGLVHENQDALRLPGDIWDDSGVSIIELVAGVDDFEVAEATYRAAVARWPRARITLRQGIRVVHDTR